VDQYDHSPEFKKLITAKLRIVFSSFVEKIAAKSTIESNVLEPETTANEANNSF